MFGIYKKISDLYLDLFNMMCNKEMKTREEIDKLRERVKELEDDLEFLEDKVDKNEHTENLRWEALKDYLSVQEEWYTDYEKNNALSGTLESGGVVNPDYIFYTPVKKLKLVKYDRRKTRKKNEQN